MVTQVLCLFACCRMRLVFLLLLLAHFVSAQESRINYGVIFRPVARITTGTQDWLHTFQLTVPNEVFHPLQSHACPASAVPQTFCQVHNFLVNVFNDYAQGLQDKIKHTVNHAKNILDTG